MTWTKLLGSRDVQHHRTSKSELDDIRALVARDLADATVAGLSAGELVRNVRNSFAEYFAMILGFICHRTRAYASGWRDRADCIKAISTSESYQNQISRVLRVRVVHGDFEGNPRRSSNA